MSFGLPGDQPDSTGELPAIEDLPQPGRGLSPQARRRWLSAVGATAALALLAGGVLTLLPHHRRAVTTLADDCGLINCGAALPGAMVTSSPPDQVSTARPHHRTGTPASRSPSGSKSHRATPTARPTPTPAKPSPTPKPPPVPDVGVTYTVDSQHNFWGNNHFHGHLTIVNHSSRSVSGWAIQLTLPGDRIRWVSYRQGWSQVPFSNWGFSGSTLTMTAASGAETLAPGASQTVYIEGDGSADSPTGCSFNGATCHP